MSFFGNMNMWDLIWVSIQDFSKKAVFLAENAINENASFSRKNGVMTFLDPKINGVMTFLEVRKIHLPDPVPQ